LNITSIAVKCQEKGYFMVMQMQCSSNFDIALTPAISLNYNLKRCVQQGNISHCDACVVAYNKP